MPVDAVVVNVVEDRQARLVGLVDVEFGIVGLGSLLVASLRPGVVAEGRGHAVGGGDLCAACRPEPSEGAQGDQVLTVLATLEVAQTTGRPDVRHVV